MKKAVIIYQSKTGITEKFAKEISHYLSDKGIETQVMPVSQYKEGSAEKGDYLLLGCWTAGLMLLFQHPDAVWKQFASRLPGLSDKKIALFTTYKIATGSMFKSMKKHLGTSVNESMIELKSKKGNLSSENMELLDRMCS